ncbi:MAG TPA: diaminopimelate decarboxylase, partial [Acidimicrobiales bacterium]|nr:diaminopimelate decarboxylase [Acidimicrobiales bacterium]
MPPLRRHLLPLTAGLEAGRLTVGGVDVLELVERHGTPLFVYDEEHLRQRCREAVAAFGDGVAYASKAFMCKAMAALAHEERMGLDVSTAGEVHVALAAGVPPGRLVFHGNNKSEEELATALDVGVHRIVVDSFDEIDRLEALVAAGRRPAPALLRVTPGIEAHTHEYVRTGQEDSKFGFGLASGAAAEAVAQCRVSPAVTLVGLHVHIGSQIFLAHSFAKAVDVVADFVRPLDLPELCMGGG